MDCDLNDTFRSLDDFATAVYSKDLNVRQDTFFKLEEYLKNDHSRLECSNLPKFCDAILEWVNCSNFKVSINGLTILQLLIHRQTEQLRHHSIESKKKRILNFFFYIKRIQLILTFIGQLLQW